jgi:hypothetical protein
VKTYYVRFGSGDPRSNSGLSPTFLSFNNYGTAVTPPGITSVIGATGFYAFQYGTTTPIVFLIDGATTGLDNSVRFVTGAIDPVDRADEYGTTIVAQGTSSLAQGLTLLGYGASNIALGTTGVAIGTSLIALGNTILAGSGGSGNSLSAEILLRIGATTSTFGSNVLDPGDLFGYMKRMQEFLEGNQQFTKTSGAWQINSRGGSLLATKSLSNSSTVVTKS